MDEKSTEMQLYMAIIDNSATSAENDYEALYIYSKCAKASLYWS